MTEGDILGAIECHDAGLLESFFQKGLDARLLVKGKSLVTWLLEMYTRTDRFAHCLRTILDHGGTLDDPETKDVLLNDAVSLQLAIAKNPGIVTHRTTIVSAFTPLVGATLLHVAAEYGHRDAAEVLLDAGADVNARAATDEYGFDGHTSLFHTVNSNANRSEPIMRLLIDRGADCSVRLPGLTWGRGFEWETVCYDVTPVSYCQFGLLRQFQRKESEIYGNIESMLIAMKRASPPLSNVPNRYLSS